MEYQKIINLLDNTPNEPSKFRTRYWVEINDESRRRYNVSYQIKFKTSTIRWNLCDYSDVYIHVKETITVPNTGTGASPNNKNKKVIFVNCGPFINCISEIINTQVNDAHDIDVVMPMYNLMEYSDTYSKTSENVWQYNRDEPTLSNNGNLIDFPNDNISSISFKHKQQITRQTGNNRTKDVEIMVSLKYLSNFWRTFQMPLINCEISLILTWSKNCFLVASTAVNQEPKFTITDTKLYVPVATLSTQDNVKLLKQLESDFKRTINWNKYQSEVIE